MSAARCGGSEKYKAPAAVIHAPILLVAREPQDDKKFAKRPLLHHHRSNDQNKNVDATMTSWSSLVTMDPIDIDFNLADRPEIALKKAFQCCAEWIAATRERASSDQPVRTFGEIATLELKNMASGRRHIWSLVTFFSFFLILALAKLLTMFWELLDAPLFHFF
jgi:hypothetical protein